MENGVNNGRNGRLHPSNQHPHQIRLMHQEIFEQNMEKARQKHESLFNDVIDTRFETEASKHFKDIRGNKNMPTHAKEHLERVHLSFE